MTFFDCSDSTPSIFYLGAPGDLQVIRTPQDGYSRLPDPHYIVHELLDGYAVDQSVLEQRKWELNFGFTSFTVRNVIEEIRTGARGLGPYVFIDPNTTNCFTPNIASGTNVALNTDGFSVTGAGESISSSKTIALQGDRSLRWDLPASVVGGIMLMTTAYCASGWATPDGQDWSMSGYVAGGGSDPEVEITPRLSWLDSTGVCITNTDGTPISSVDGSWTAFTVAGTTPADAIYVLPQLVVTPGSVSDTAILYLDKMMLDMRLIPRGWVVGEGQPRVAIIPKRETVNVIGLTSMAYDLVELTV